jgi:apolipoprotein D and lipocalin family protein
MKKRIWTFITAALFFGGCAHMPEGAKAVTGFEKEKYLGKWYEIARLDFKYEKDLNNTTAEYTARDDGYIGVTNRGYNYIKKERVEAVGKARFRGADSVGELEVSFFGPFYGAYNILALDKDYKYALIAGSSLKYLWILSREKSVPDEIKAQYLDLAKSLKYRTEDLIWVEHDK